jgi:hypothetical protein
MALGGKTNLPMLMEYYLKRPSKAKACGLQVLTSGSWDRWSFLGCLSCEEKYETGGWEHYIWLRKKDKTMPLFLRLILGDCTVFLWAVNNKGKQYMMSITCFQLLFCFVLFAFLAPALSIDCCFVTLCDKVVPHDTYAPSHQDCWNVFFINLWETYVYIIIWAEA